MKLFRDTYGHERSVWEDFPVLESYSEFKEDLYVDAQVGVTMRRIDKNYDLYCDWIEFFINYPDCFIDLITPSHNKVSLYFYQRMALRTNLRYNYNMLTATRAYSKSFMAILSLYLICIFEPRSNVSLSADIKEQAANIAQEKIDLLTAWYPLLEKEKSQKVGEKPRSGKGYIDLTFNNKSKLGVLGASDGSRGGRRTTILLEEVAFQDAEPITEVLLPTLNVSRINSRGEVNPHQPQGRQILITTAYSQGCYAYQRQREFVVKSVLEDTAFVAGASWVIPHAEGLLSQERLNDALNTKAGDPGAFAREYESKWTEGSGESLYQGDRFSSHQVIKRPELARDNNAPEETFYIVGVDVAKDGNAETVAVVTKNFPQNGRFVSRVVFLDKTHEPSFLEQSIWIQDIVERFDAEEVVIDTTGVGAGLLDHFVQERIDKKGNIYYPLGLINPIEDKQGFKDQKKLFKALAPDAPKKIRQSKANATLNSEMAKNVLSRIVNGQVKFLIPEYEARTEFSLQKQWQELRLVDKTKKLAPYSLTDQMKEQFLNLKKQNDVDGRIERISNLHQKDFYSAIELALYQVKIKQEQWIAANNKKGKSLVDILLTLNT